MISPTIELAFEDEPSPADVDRLRQGLHAHASAFVDRPGFQPLALFARDRGGRIAGGAFGYVNWTWLDVSLLWVEESYRGRGLGSRILEAFEAAARERGCTQARVDTFSFQAPSFYERHGYREYAELPDYPPGYRRLFYRKEL